MRQTAARPAGITGGEEHETLEISILLFGRWQVQGGSRHGSWCPLKPVIPAISDGLSICFAHLCSMVEDSPV